MFGLALLFVYAFFCSFSILITLLGAEWLFLILTDRVEYILGFLAI